MGSCNTFREELAIPHPRHGHALSEPDPGGLCDSVEVGHVGFIRDGCFFPLFNALSPPSDSDSEGPKYPPQLQPKKSPHIRSSTDNQQCFCSDSVTRVPCDSNPYTLGPDEEPPLKFSSSGKKGALLYLPLLSERHDTVARGDFGEWMLENIDTCFKVAEDLGYGIERMEDIILVTGCHLAKSWVSATFSDSRGGSEVSFGVRVSRNSGVYFDERNVKGRGLKLGPSGENLPQNQCIFVRGFRVTRILNIWPRLRGAGPAPDFGERESESDRRLELISIPADADYQDPLHILSAHIAEQAPDCNMILVHDDDLQFIDDASDDWELMQDTQRYGSVIRQVQCVLPGDETRSGPEAASNTVATLSKDVFEEQHENWHDLAYSCPTPIMSRSASVISQPKSPEIVGPVSSGLRRSIPPISSHGEFVSSIADIPALTIPSQELVTDSVAPPPDSSPKRPSHSVPQICSPPSFPRPTDWRLLSHVVSMPHCSPYSPLRRPHSSVPMTPAGPCSPILQKALQQFERPIPDRRIRGEPNSSDKHPRRYEDGSSLSHVQLPSQTSQFQRPRTDYLSDFSSPLGPIPSYLDLSLSVFTEEHGPGSDGSDGFSSDTSRAVRLLSDRNNDGYRPSSRRRFIAPEYLEASIYPALPPRGIVDRSDGNSRSRSSGRTDPSSRSSSYSSHTTTPILTFDFSNRTPSLLRRPSHPQGTWHIMQDASAVSLPSFGVSNTLLPLNLRIKTTQGMLIPQRRWTIPLEGEVYRHVDGTTLDILQGHGYDPRERSSGPPLERRPTTHIRINWPGYSHQTQCITTRDPTNPNPPTPITLVRFMNCVGTSVDASFDMPHQQYFSYTHDNVANAGREVGPR